MKIGKRKSFQRRESTVDIDTDKDLEFKLFGRQDQVKSMY